MEQKNGLGAFCALAVLFAFYMREGEQSKQSRNYLLILAIINIVLLIMSQSKTSLGAFIVAAGFIKFHQWNGNRFDLKVIAPIVFFICVFFCVFHIFFSVKEYYKILIAALETIGKNDTFTGRYPLWKILFFIGYKQHPILGSGYGSFFTGENSAWLLDYMNFDAGTAHSGYLQIFLELGAVGLLLFIVFLGIVTGALIKKSFRTSKDITFIGGVIIFTIFFNFFIVSYLRVSFPFYIFLWACVQLFDEPVPQNAPINQIVPIKQ